MYDARITDQNIPTPAKTRTGSRSPFEAQTVRVSSSCSSRATNASLNSKIFKSFEPTKSSNKYLNLSRDPYKKTHRYDYQIFSAASSPLKNFKHSKNGVNNKVQRSVERKNTMKRPESGNPARFFSTKKLREQIKVRQCEITMPGLENDLRLIKDINTVSLLKSFEMEKTYRNYLNNFQDSSLKENSINPKVKKAKQVTFRLI